MVGSVTKMITYPPSAIGLPLDVESGEGEFEADNLVHRLGWSRSVLIRNNTEEHSDE